MATLRIYFKLVRISMQSRMQYKADFITGILSIVLFNCVNIGMISILADRFTTIHGWNMWELMFLYSLWLLGHSFFSLLFWHFTSMEQYLRNGTFDQFLIRPLSPLVQFLGRELQYLGVGDIVIALLGLLLAYRNLDLHWGVAQFAFLVVAVLSGLLIEMALSWIIACLSFWTVRSFSAFLMMWQFNSMVQQYPVEIFGQWFRLVVTGLLPVAFMNYYPSLYLLGKTGLTTAENVLCFLSPLVAVVLMGLASLFWRQVLTKYSSTGS